MEKYAFLYFSVSLIVIVIVTINTVVVVDVLFLMWRKNESNQARDDGTIVLVRSPLKKKTRRLNQKLFSW